jgi:hypothetical protein
MQRTSVSSSSAWIRRPSEPRQRITGRSRCGSRRGTSSRFSPRMCLGRSEAVVLTRIEKRKRALLVTIDDFLSRVMPLLKAVSEGRNTGFFTTEQNNPWGRVSCSREGSEILATATWIVEEAERLSESEAATTASKVIEAFRVANDLNEPHRLGPIRLGQQLLAEIQQMSD